MHQKPNQENGGREVRHPGKKLAGDGPELHPAGGLLGGDYLRAVQVRPAHRNGRGIVGKKHELLQ